MMMPSLAELARRLELGDTTSRRLVDNCLERIEAPDGEGARVFRVVDAKRAVEAADAIDGLRAAGYAPSPFAGIPISVKDLFDVRGDQTLAGSTALAGEAPAVRDATAIGRLRAAGFVLIGRTNMTEFAYSGIGINPHYGTPRSPYDRDSARIPGGSSSGAAVSVSDGMAALGLGTDTGGSCRIPAALCGTVGFKPTARRIPTDGVTPLSFSLDSIGSLGTSVACCATVDALMAQPGWREPSGPSLATLRLGALTNLVLDELDAEVAASYERALGRLSASGVAIEEIEIAAVDEIPGCYRDGGIAAAEAYAWHRERIERQGDAYDPFVRARIEKGGNLSAADYIDLVQERARIIAAVDAATEHLDAIVYPTVPAVPPPIDALADFDEFTRVNLRMLRNTSVTNFLDRCAVSLPIHEADGAPVGLQLMGETMGDGELLAVASRVEEIVS